MGSNRSRNEVKPIGSKFVPCVKGISDQFKRIGDHYNYKTVFKTGHTLRSILMRSKVKSEVHPLRANSGALGERRYSSSPSSPRHWKEVSGQHHAPAALFNTEIFWRH
jgi:hypothetical protein